MSTVSPAIPAPAKAASLTAAGIGRPWLTIVAWLAAAAIFGAALPWARIDTDPKNVLPPESEVRVTNDAVNAQFGLHEDTIVLAIRPDGGVLTPENLRKLQQLNGDVLALQGIVKNDVTSLFTVDNVTSEGDELRIAPLLSEVPATPDEIEALRRQLFEGPLFKDRLISGDALTTAVYVPLEKGAEGARIAADIRAAALKSFAPEQVYIAGDPVARDLFGAEMFKLMAVFAPIAGGLMLGVMFYMFRSWWMAGVMMLAATISIVIAMGAAVALGFSIHIMSSMAPVFLMAIATDSIHIFNEFYQRWRPGSDRAAVIQETMAAVSRPVRYAALATTLGFAVLLFMMIVPVAGVPSGDDALSRFNGWVSSWAVRASGPTIALALLLGAGSIWGMSKTVVDNNLLLWFKQGSEVRRADALFSREMGGALPASLVVDTGTTDGVKDPAVLNAIRVLQRDLAEQHLVGTSLSVVDYLTQINREIGRA